MIQDYVNQTYERFLDLVGNSRRLEAGREKLAEGRVWTGYEAHELGLVGPDWRPFSGIERSGGIS